MASIEDMMGLAGSPDNEDTVYASAYSDDEAQGRTSQFDKTKRAAESESEAEEEAGEAATNETEADAGPSAPKFKILNEEENKAKLRQIKKSGVVYLSSIPPYMKPIKMKQILSRFGECGRIYLAPEDPVAYSRRVKSGGNRKKKYTEGWVEFQNKKHAKLAAEVLNGNPIGGKKGSFYYDDILNIKYLPKFKWHDLTEQIALEAQERQEKLKAEIAQATKENRVFIDNVEQKERIEHAKRKASEETPDAKAPKREPPLRRTFTQKPAKRSGNKNSAELSDVLSKIF